MFLQAVTNGFLIQTEHVCFFVVMLIDAYHVICSKYVYKIEFILKHILQRETGIFSLEVLVLIFYKAA